MENKSQFDNNMDDVLKIVNEHADEVKRKEEMAIHLLGIRHHGPGSCRNVLNYLQHPQPDLILAEAPAEAACARASLCRNGWCPARPRSAPSRRCPPAFGLRKARRPSGGCGICPEGRE